MELVLNIFYMLCGIAALYYGADFLVKGGVDIAKRLGISSLVIGLTLVAFATSAPELAVSVSSALGGNSDIALGNVIGSNISNIGLILGICGCILPLNVNRQLLKFDTPVMIISAIIVSVIYLSTGEISRIWGIVCFLLLIAYCIRNIYASRKETAQEEKNPSVYPVWLAIIIIAASLGILVGGAKIFLLSAVYFAKLLNLSDAVIGLTVVAVGTSLPELATSIVAVCKGEKDIAIGNVVGSNIFNTLGILGLTAVIKPIDNASLNYIDFAVMGFLSILLMIFMCSGKKLNRFESAVILLTYIAYTIYLCC
ncbi:MAG: calcium/sodium antiporter [Lentisphaeria bacterium]|nr:calcium/sodium antiporter [Lentisphaeria bacterium]